MTTCPTCVHFQSDPNRCVWRPRDGAYPTWLCVGARFLSRADMYQAEDACPAYLPNPRADEPHGTPA